VPAAAAAPPAAAARPLADPKLHLDLVNQLRSADEARAQGRLLDAIGIYRRTVESDPGMPAAWRQLGGLLLTTGQPKDALEAFARAVEIENDMRGLTGAVSALLRLGRVEDAARIAAHAAKADAVAGNELLVRVELRRKDYLAAHRAAEAAKAADAESPMPAFARGMELYQAEKFAEAVVPLDEAARLAGNRAVRPDDVLFYSGDALARVKKFSDAEARLSEELQWFPGSIRAREVLASVYQETGRAAEISAIVDGLIRALPTPEGYAAASRLLATYGDKAEAAAMRARGRQLFGESALRAAEVSARQ
jgi:tetratricopeptide (TPR) repeat protein